jgi:hypothetical protein
MFREQEQSSQMHNFLIEEYKHASEYSLNTMRDRTQTFNLYIVLLGALSYAFVLIHTGYPAIDVNLFTIGLLGFYSVINFFFFARFVTLEVNYRDSILRMDEIRQHYKMRFESDAIKKIYSVDREFISPTRLRPTNSIICGVYTLLEVGSLVWLGTLLGGYWLLAFVLVAAIAAALQYRYYIVVLGSVTDTIAKFKQALPHIKCACLLPLDGNLVLTCSTERDSGERTR